MNESLTGKLNFDAKGDRPGYIVVIINVNPHPFYKPDNTTEATVSISREVTDTHDFVYIVCLVVFSATFNNISVIFVTVSFIVGRNRTKPLTCCKSLTNFIT